jgi:hypothetical protein
MKFHFFFVNHSQTLVIFIHSLVEVNIEMTNFVVVIPLELIRIVFLVHAIGRYHSYNE